MGIRKVSTVEFGNETKLLLHFDGSNDSTNFIDSSNSRHIVTALDGAKLKTDTKKFGTASGLFDGSGDCLSIPDSADWDFGSGDFTIDFWMKLGSVGGNDMIFGQSDDVSNRILISIDGASGQDIYVQVKSADLNVNISNAHGIVDSNFHHVAVVRYGNVWNLYIDGTSIGNVTDAGTMTNMSDEIYIGGATTDGGSTFFYFPGYLDEFRISKGIARWTSNFTPQESPYAFLSKVLDVPAGRDTKLLLHLDGSDGATSTSDSSPQNHSISFNGDAQLDTDVKKFGTASLLLDGTGDSLDIADSSDWDILTTTNFTIDLWVKLKGGYDDQYFVMQYEDGSNRWGFANYGTTNSYLRFWFLFGGGIIVDTGTVQDGSGITDHDWHHVALCKVGNEYGIYIDGSQVEYTNDSSTDTLNGSLYIGSHEEAIFTDANIDELRIAHDNILSASPNVGETDTITVPTSSYGLISKVLSVSN